MNGILSDIYRDTMRQLTVMEWDEFVRAIELARARR
jgi:hypothetical protein